MSGGKTSAYMTKKLLDTKTDEYNIVVCFANTGQENNQTLEFINKCDQQFNFNTIWLETVVNGEGVGCSHKIVTYETANRNGKPFEDVVKKYGIPNNGYPHCTKMLKEEPIHSYIKSIGWKRGEYFTAIGIRTDEPHRVRRNKTIQNKIYPLVDWFPTDKLDILDFWEEQSFQLQLEDYQGNCKWCYKKSNKKLFQIIKDDESIFDFPIMLEDKYGLLKPTKINGVVVDKPRRIFRNYVTARDMVAMAKSQAELLYQEDNEEYEGCASSCEAFATDDETLD